MKRTRKIFLFAVGIVSVTMDEFSRALGEAAQSVKEPSKIVIKRVGSISKQYSSKLTGDRS
jgi:hypothetical protein